MNTVNIVYICEFAICFTSYCLWQTYWSMECMCVCVCVCVHACMYICMQVFMNVCTYVSMPVYQYVCSMWALGFAPHTGESTRWKPTARTLICHWPFGQPNTRPWVLVEYSEDTIHNKSCKYVTLKCININQGRKVA